MKLVRPAIALMVVLLAVSARAAEVEDLAWMAGHWIHEENGASSEEGWLAPKGGLMLGVSRTVSAKGKASFEFIRIQKTSDGVTYLASPGGREATPFPLKSHEDKRVVFENLTHDFPQRIIYWQKSADAMCARIEGTVSGETEGEEWCWTRK